MWIPISTSPRCDNTLKPTLKRAHGIRRHEPHVRERDGAAYDSYPNTRAWNCDRWLNALSAASDEVRFACCPDSHGEPQYIRSVQCHSGVLRIDPPFFTLLVQYKWKGHMYHTGFSNIGRSIVNGGLIAGSTSDRRGRQACARLLGCGPVREVVARFSETSPSAVLTFDLKIVEILSKRQPCDCSVWHHAVRNMCKSCDTTQVGERNSIRYKICKNHRRHTLIQPNWNGRKPGATRCGSSTRKTAA